MTVRLSHITPEKFFIGSPLPSDQKRKSRRSTRYSESSPAKSSPAYIPSALFKKSTEELAKEGKLSESVDSLAAVKPITIELLKKMKEDLKNHAENRISSFLIQSLLAYQSGLTFSKGQTTSQMGKSPNFTPDKSPYAAAHDATLPSLHCQPKHSTKIYEFAKGTRFEEIFNMTILLPKFANHPIDTALDSAKKRIGVSKSLRERSIEILNFASATRGEYEPLDALKEFVKVALRRLKNIEGVYKDEMERYVVKQYISVFKNYKTMLEDDHDHEFLRRFTSIPPTEISDEDLLGHIRNMFYTQMSLSADRVSRSSAKSKSISADRSESVLGATAEKYVLQCSRSKPVKDIFLRYKEKISLEGRKKDKNVIKALESDRKKDVSAFPKNTREIYESCLTIIRNVNKEDGAFKPKKMVQIVYRVIENLEEQCKTKFKVLP